MAVESNGNGSHINWAPLRKSMDVGPSGSVLPAERSKAASATSENTQRMAPENNSTLPKSGTVYMDSGQPGSGLEKIRAQAEAVRRHR
jgi:hypothetical protein